MRALNSFSEFIFHTPRPSYPPEIAFAINGYPVTPCAVVTTLDFGDGKLLNRWRISALSCE